MKDLKELIKENQKQNTDIDVLAYLRGVTDCANQLFKFAHSEAKNLQNSYINQRNIIKKVNVIIAIYKISTVITTIRDLATGITKFKDIKNKDININNYLDDMLIHVTGHGINNLSNKIDKLVNITDVDIDELV